jgi:hypothetical protein
LIALTDPGGRGLGVVELVHERRQLAEPDVQALADTEQRRECRVALPAHERVDLALAEPGCLRERLLAHAVAFRDDRLYRSGERRMISADRLRLPFRRHPGWKLIPGSGREFSGAPTRAGVTHYMSYQSHRQSSSSGWDLACA